MCTYAVNETRMRAWVAKACVLDRGRGPGTEGEGLERRVAGIASTARGGTDYTGGPVAGGSGIIFW